MNEKFKRTSSIERKIKSFNLTPRSNNLPFQQKLPSELINEDSKESLSKLLKLEVKDMNILSLLDLPEYNITKESLQNIISNCAKDCTVILPGIEIQIESLHITSPIHLKGSSGSKLLVNNGTILIENTRNLESFKVIFSEI